MTEQEWLARDKPAEMLEFLVHGPRASDHEDSPGRRHWLGRGNRSDPSDRKLRLWACACVRQVWHLLTDERSRRAVEVAERYADGKATELERHEARTRANWSSANLPMLAQATCYRNETIVRGLLDELQMNHQTPPATQANLLRDIVGNPFRPAYVVHRRGGEWAFDQQTARRTGKRCVSIGIVGKCILMDREWLTSTVRSIAEAAYNERPGRKCEPCEGTGNSVCYPSIHHDGKCSSCHGTGRIDDGTLCPDRLAVLADALEEGGCTSVEVLGHLRGVVCRLCQGQGIIDRPVICGPDTSEEDMRRLADEAGGPIVCPSCRGRKPAPCVRGCWVIDLLLGKQ